MLFPCPVRWAPPPPLAPPPLRRTAAMIGTRGKDEVTSVMGSAKGLRVVRSYSRRADSSSVAL